MTRKSPVEYHRNDSHRLDSSMNAEISRQIFKLKQDIYVWFQRENYKLLLWRENK